MTFKKQYIFEFLAVSAFVAIFFSLYHYFQPQIRAGGGFGWDGLHYFKIFQKFVTGKHIDVMFPICNRVGTPWLASLVPDQNVFLSFKFVNLLFSSVFSITIYLIARYTGFNIYYSLLALTLTLIPFFSPLRFTHFYPVYSDPAFLVFLSISFLFLIRKQFGLAFAFLAISYPFREAAIYIAPLYLCFALYLGGVKRNIIIKFLISFAFILACKFAIANYMNCEGSQMMTALEWLKKGLSKPERFIGWFAAISMTAAPLLYLRKIESLSEIQKVSIVGFAASALLALFGGSDSTRIFYSFFPLYFLLIIAVMQARGYVFSIICILGYVITNRVPEKIMEPLRYWPARDEGGFFWQYPDQARPEVGLMIISVWLILFFCYDQMLSSSEKPAQK